MAEKLCELKKKGGGGGKYTETSLWTNPSPTSDFAGGQNVTLSDSISNYKYIKINFAYAASYNTGKCNTSIVISTDDFKDMTYNTNDRRNGVSLSCQNTSNTAYSRMAIYISDTTVRFGTCYQVPTNTTANANCIPLEILGLNELAHGKRESSLGTLSYQTSSNFKVTLGFKPKALQVFMRGNDSNTITLQYDENISTTKYVRNYTGSSAQSGWQTIGSTTSQRRLWSIDDDGFTLTPNTDTSTPTIYYSAVGDV